MAKTDNITTEAAALAFSLIIAAAAGEHDAQGMKVGVTRAYTKDEQIQVLETLGKLLTKSSEIILGLLDKVDGK